MHQCHQRLLKLAILNYGLTRMCPIHYAAINASVLGTANKSANAPLSAPNVEKGDTQIRTAMQP